LWGIKKATGNLICRLEQKSWIAKSLKAPGNLFVEQNILWQKSWKNKKENYLEQK
jgi:hypothetical protein